MPAPTSSPTCWLAAMTRSGLSERTMITWRMTYRLATPPCWYWLAAASETEKPCSSTCVVSSWCRAKTHDQCHLVLSRVWAAPRSLSATTTRRGQKATSARASRSEMPFTVT